jgi:hypothetical protein
VGEVVDAPVVTFALGEDHIEVAGDEADQFTRGHRGLACQVQDGNRCDSIEDARDLGSSWGG